MSVSPRLQSWLEMRGVACSNDPEFIKVVPWTRTTFALCTTLVAVGTVFAYPPLLWAMVPIALLGAIFSIHPFDFIYNYGLRHLTRTRELPRNAPPTRFACGIASAWVSATALSFQLGVAPLGYVLGGLLVSVGATISITHFCIPSFIYQIAFGDPELSYQAVGRRERTPTGS